MTDYTITTDFGAKDSLPSGNAAKVIKGSEFTTEFTSIQTAVATKADTAGDTFTGVVNFSADVAVNTNTLFVDVSEAKVGIGTTSPASKLHVRGSDSGATGVAGGTLIVEQGSAPSIQILSANTQTQSIKFGDPEDGDVGKINYSHADNHMALFTDGTEAVRIDSSGNVGIGTTSPSAPLDIIGQSIKLTGANPIFYFFDNTNTNTCSLQNTDGNFIYRADSGNQIGNSKHTFKIDGTDVMRLDNTGLGIGTTSPSEKLDIDGDSIRLRQAQTPASATATGTQGQIAWDVNYIYVCTATNTWKRVAIATW